jgi:hypothetical protein
MVAPVLGMPLAVKYALNQMNVSRSMEAPLKLEVFVEAEQPGRITAKLAMGSRNRPMRVIDHGFLM